MRAIFVFLLLLPAGCFAFLFLSGGGYIVSAEPPGERQDAPPAPDMSAYTAARIKAQAPALRKGKVFLAEMSDLPALRTFSREDSGLRFHRLAQRDVRPKALVIETGNYDLPRLCEAMRALGEGITKQEGVYTLRLPLLVKRGASLQVTGGTLRLSREKGAFIAVAGDLFILDAAVTGGSAPTLLHEEETFRPFITVWSGGRLFIADSAVSALGYAGDDAHGVSLSACRSCLEAAPGRTPPTGVIVGSTFTHMYKGLYARDAEGVAIVGNTYKDNVVFGIAADENSRRLIIAGNDISGTRQRHGIVLSRGVKESWISGNNSHDNKGSGIVLDRAGSGNVVSGTTSARNGRDGIAFLESDGNATWNNSVFANAAAGIRLRNSRNTSLSGDRVADNRGAPVTATGGSARLSGVTLRARDGGAAFKMDGIDELALEDINILSGGPVFADGVLEGEAGLADALREKTGSLVIRRVHR